MAQFYADIQGNRGGASRMGTKGSGISAHVRGWDVGARVICAHENGRDVVRVYRTGGSNGASTPELLAEFTEASVRLEYLRRQLRAERISLGELGELESLADQIEPGDIELLEAAGVPEFSALDSAPAGWDGSAPLA